MATPTPEPEQHRMIRRQDKYSMPEWLKMAFAVLLLAVIAFWVIWFATQPGASQ